MSGTYLWAWAVVVCLFSAPMVCAQSQPASDVSSAPSSVAAVPRLIKYSGVVRDARGEPLNSVAVRLTFAVYEEQQGGAALWVETQMAQLDEQGRYSVLLGATRADGLPVELFPAGKARWLGVQAEGRDEDPRVLLVSVPYALKAEDAAMLGGRQASDFVLGEQLKEEVRTQVAAQTPGIATQAAEMLVSNPPKAPAIAEGPSTFTCTTTGDCVAVTQSGTGHALRGTATSASETVLVQQNGTGYGLRALAAGNVALYGQITGSAGTSYGVKGLTTSTTGAGVFGYNQATTGLAYGILGQTASTEGTALFGRATATTGATIGLRGHADSTSGVGIMGQATATSGTTTGIVGRVFSVDGTALIVDNTKGGKLLSGQANGVEKFSVSGSGNVVAAGTFSGNGSGLTGVNAATATYATSAGSAGTAGSAGNADMLDGLHASAFQRAGAHGVREFFASASFTVPANITSLMVEMWGSGGGGSSADDCSGGVGGGGGAYTRGVIAVVPGAVYEVVVGAGGGTFGGGISGPGGDSQILDEGANVLIFAGGGGGGSVGGASAGGRADPSAGISHSGMGSNGSIGGPSYAGNLAPQALIGNLGNGAYPRCNGNQPGSGGQGYVLVVW